MFIILIGLTAGCAKPATETGGRMHLWPAPPEEPKIAHIATYTGPADFHKPSFVDIFVGAPEQSGLKTPFGVSSRNDTIYAALVRDGRVAIIDPVARNVSFIGDEGDVKLSAPMGIAVDAQNMIYVSDTKRREVVSYDQMGVFRRVFGANEKNNPLERPIALAVNDELKRLYVVDTRGHRVKTYSTANGAWLFDFGKAGERDGEFKFPTGISLDRRNGNLVVVDSQNHRIQVFDRDGKFLKKFGQAGDGIGSFGLPKSAAVDSEGHIYVIDSFLQNFQVFSENGEPLLLISGGNTQRRGHFETPSGIYVDEKDRIYLTDQLLGVVHVFQYLSEPWKKEHPEDLNNYIILNDERLTKEKEAENAKSEARKKKR
jgi:DNA-binding beta-propeller fold protein YncE